MQVSGDFQISRTWHLASDDFNLSHIEISYFMILEVAILFIKKGHAKAFEKDFRKAKPFIQNNPGYISHELSRCMEKEEKYILLVRWETLEDHEEGFRKSENYLPWKELLHHYYEPFPIVEHYELY